jgi:hypothetical protein
MSVATSVSMGADNGRSIEAVSLSCRMWGGDVCWKMWERFPRTGWASVKVLLFETLVDLCSLY